MLSRKFQFKSFIQLTLALFVSLAIVSCGDDDDMMTGDIVLTGESKVYEFNELNNSGVTGTVTLEETSRNFTVLTFTLDGTPAGGMHPAHIHNNSAVIGGGIAISLDPVDGNTGESQTVIEALDDGTPITYEELLDFDGYINVHLSAEELQTVVAQTDIGSNELTGEALTYPLGERAVAGISGQVVFEERKNGFALATITLEGTPDGGEHPAHIHANSAAVGGGILYTFNPVNGTTGSSQSGIRNLDDGSVFNYSQIESFEGYVNVHLSASELATIVAQGDIGANALTGESISYPLSEMAVPGISGTLLLQERVNGFTLATIELSGTPQGGMHPAHIHANSAAEGGPIIYSFEAVDGDTGRSVNDIRALDDGTSISYNDLLVIDGYVNVHLSMSDLATLVAQGDIGSNF